MGDIVEHISDKDLELYKVHKDSFFFYITPVSGVCFLPHLLPEKKKML